MGLTAIQVGTLRSISPSWRFLFQPIRWARAWTRECKDCGHSGADRRHGWDYEGKHHQSCREGWETGLVAGQDRCVWLKLLSEEIVDMWERQSGSFCARLPKRRKQSPKGVSYVAVPPSMSEPHPQFQNMWWVHFKPLGFYTNSCLPGHIKVEGHEGTWTASLYHSSLIVSSKMRIIIGVGIAILLVIIIVPIVKSVKWRVETLALSITHLILRVFSTPSPSLFVVYGLSLIPDRIYMWSGLSI